MTSAQWRVSFSYASSLALWRFCSGGSDAAGPAGPVLLPRHSQRDSRRVDGDGVDHLEPPSLLLAAHGAQALGSLTIRQRQRHPVDGHERKRVARRLAPLRRAPALWEPPCCWSPQGSRKPPDAPSPTRKPATPRLPVDAQPAPPSPTAVGGARRPVLPRQTAPTPTAVPRLPPAWLRDAPKPLEIPVPHSRMDQWTGSRQVPDGVWSSRGSELRVALRPREVRSEHLLVEAAGRIAALKRCRGPSGNAPATPALGQSNVSTTC